MTNEGMKKRLERLEHVHSMESKLDADRRIYDAAFSTGRIERKDALQNLNLAIALGFTDMGDYFECEVPQGTGEPSEAPQTLK